MKKTFLLQNFSVESTEPIEPIEPIEFSEVSSKFPSGNGKKIDRRPPKNDAPCLMTRGYLR